jgi:pimeloyl-ACP methyl ester carboxylesterase
MGASLNGTAWRDRYYASTDGLQLHYRDYPAASDGRLPVLCLPGLTRNCRDFESTALRLQQTRRVLSPDLRGRGRSQYDPQWRNYHPGTYLDDIDRLLRDADAGQVILLGTSLGGILSMLIAASAPRVPAAVILNDIGPEVASEGMQRIASYVGRHPPVASWDEAARQMRAMYRVAMPDAGDDDWMAFARRSYTEVDGVPQLDVDPGIGEAVRAAPASGAPHLWPVYAALRLLPVLAIRGELSDVLSAATFERMAREKADLERLTVARRGHPPLLDEPECVATIDAFLARLP